MCYGPSSLRFRLLQPWTLAEVGLGVRLASSPEASLSRALLGSRKAVDLWPGGRSSILHSGIGSPSTAPGRASGWGVVSLGDSEGAKLLMEESETRGLWHLERDMFLIPWLSCQAQKAPKIPPFPRNLGRVDVASDVLSWLASLWANQDAQHLSPCSSFPASLLGPEGTPLTHPKSHNPPCEFQLHLE